MGRHQFIISSGKTMKLNNYFSATFVVATWAILGQCQAAKGGLGTSMPYNGIAEEGKVVTTFGTWGPNYTISFNMEFESAITVGSSWKNLFQFTTTGQNGYPAKSYGDRLPAVYFRNPGGNNDQILVYVGMTNVKSLVLPSTSSIANKQFNVPTNAWQEVELQQRLTSENQAIFTAKLNGELIWTVETKMTNFQNVIWYQSCPTKSCGYASIGNNVEIEGMTVTNDESGSCELKGNTLIVEGSIEASTAGECQAQCQDDPSCQFFTYNEASRGCGLRNFIPGGRSFALGNISGLKNESPIAWSQISNSVYVGKSLSVDTAEYCKIVCLADNNCNTMIFNELLSQCSLNYGKAPFREIPLNPNQFGISSCQNK